MSIQNELSEKELAFLLELFQCTKGDLSAQVSMSDVGRPLGMDKEQASRATEALMSFGFAEIRTLSGGIGICAEGVAEVRKRGAFPAGAQEAKLGNKAVMDEKSLDSLKKVLHYLKKQVQEMQLSYESSDEIMSDIKTIETQMLSPAPKTAIIRECFISIRKLLKKNKNPKSSEIVEQFIRE